MEYWLKESQNTDISTNHQLPLLKCLNFQILSISAVKGRLDVFLDNFRNSLINIFKITGQNRYSHTFLGSYVGPLHTLSTDFYASLLFLYYFVLFPEIFNLAWFSSERPQITLTNLHFRNATYMLEIWWFSYL